jgi:hypothetical protein
MPETTEPAVTYKSVDEVLLAFQADLPRLFKNRDGQVGNQRTKYADLVQANEVIIPRLNGMGCIWVCTPLIVGTDPGRFVLHYELTHVPSGTKREGSFPILGDSPMKHGSAITYARRYALLAVTGVIPEDDDDDGQAFEEGVQRRPPSGRARQARPAQAPGATRRHAGPAPAGRGTTPPLPGDEAEPVGDEDTARPDAPSTVDRRQVTRIQTLFGELGYGGDPNRDTRLDIVRRILRLDAPPASTNDLSADEAKTVIDALVARAKQSGAPQSQEG